MLIIMFIGYDWLCRHFYLVLLACLLFLIATLIFGTGWKKQAIRAGSALAAYLVFSLLNFKERFIPLTRRTFTL